MNENLQPEIFNSSIAPEEFDGGQARRLLKRVVFESFRLSQGSPSLQKDILTCHMANNPAFVRQAQVILKDQGISDFKVDFGITAKKYLASPYHVKDPDSGEAYDVSDGLGDMVHALNYSISSPDVSVCSLRIAAEVMKRDNYYMGDREKKSTSEYNLRYSSQISHFLHFAFIQPEMNPNQIGFVVTQATRGLVEAIENSDMCGIKKHFVDEYGRQDDDFRIAYTFKNFNFAAEKHLQENPEHRELVGGFLESISELQKYFMDSYEQSRASE